MARFRGAVLALTVLALCGGLRVSLAVKAAEAAIDASTLREELRAERLESRTLEADRSSLAAPSRIEALASEALNMGRPAEVCYLEVPSTGEESGAGTDADARPPAIVRTLMHLAADEANALLVGDMGLGSDR